MANGGLSEIAKDFGDAVENLGENLEKEKNKKEKYDKKDYPIEFKGGFYRRKNLPPSGGFKFLTLEKYNGPNKKPSSQMATIKYRIKENSNIKIKFPDGVNYIGDVHKIEKLDRSINAPSGLGIELIKQYKRHIMDEWDIVFLQNEAHTLDGQPNFGYYSSKKNQFADHFEPNFIHSYFIKGKNIRKVPVKTLNNIAKQTKSFFGS